MTLNIVMRMITKNINTDFVGDIKEHRHYPLPKSGELIQLVFLGDKGIPFCTLRSTYSKMGNKIEYYKSKIW